MTTIQMMMVVVLVKMAIMMLMMNLSVSKLSSALIAKFEIVLSLARRSYLYCGTEKLDKKHHHRRRQHHRNHRHHHHNCVHNHLKSIVILEPSYFWGRVPPWGQTSQVDHVSLKSSRWDSSFYVWWEFFGLSYIFLKLTMVMMWACKFDEPEYRHFRCPPKLSEVQEGLRKSMV